MNISWQEESFQLRNSMISLCPVSKVYWAISNGVIPYNASGQPRTMGRAQTYFFFYLLGNLCQITKSKWHDYNGGLITRKSHVIQDGLELYVLLSSQVARMTLNFWSSNLSLLSTRVEDLCHYFWFMQCWRKILWAISTHSTTWTASLTSSCLSC